MYDQNDYEKNDQNNSEAPQSGSERPESDEYHYTRQDRPGSYFDAEYRSERSYRPVYVPSNQKPVKPPRERKHSGISAAGLIAICLVCAILGGLAGAGGVALMNRNNPEAAAVAAETQQPQSEQQAETDVSTPQPTVKQTQNAAAPKIASSTESGDTLTPASIYERACQQVVGVTTEITYTNYFGQTSAGAVTGSGFIISSDGYIMTNYHVIEDAYTGGYEVSVILYNGDSYSAEIVGIESDNDIAVLKIEASGLTPATLGNSDNMRVGESVYAVGNPLGELSYTMTTGSVSALDREITTSSSIPAINMFQIDAAVNSGNSGGPVYNSQGEVIGVVTAKYSDTGVEGLGFAIPVNDAIYIANELMTNGYVSGKAYMGVILQDISRTAIEYYNLVPGAYVYSITPGSAAAKCGLALGDIITKIDELEVSTKAELSAEVKTHRAGESATLTVFRSGEYVELQITFDEQVPTPQAGQQQQQQQPSMGYGGFGDW